MTEQDMIQSDDAGGGGDKAPKIDNAQHKGGTRCKEDGGENG